MARTWFGPHANIVLRNKDMGPILYTLNVSDVGAYAAIDNFNRPDGPIGGNWLQGILDDPSNVAYYIISGAVTRTTSGHMYYNQLLSGNQSASVTVATLPLNYVGISICYAPGFDTGYIAYHSVGSSLFILQKDVNGVLTTLSSVSGTLSAGDILGISLAGTTLSLYKNATLITSAVDSTLTSGYPGLYLEDGNVRVDDFTFGTLDTTTSSMVATSPVSDTGSTISESIKLLPIRTVTDLGTSFTLADDFNRPDGAVGNNWTGGILDHTPGVFTISSNKLRWTSGGHMYYNALSLTGNQSASVTVSTLPVGWMGISICHDPGFNTGYIAYYYTGGAFYLYKLVNGVGGQVASVAGSLTAGDLFGIILSGSNLSVLKNGTVVLSTSDSALTSGYPGLYLEDSTVRIDDFTFGINVPTTESINLFVKRIYDQDFMSISDSIGQKPFIAVADTGVTISDSNAFSVYTPSLPATDTGVTISESIALMITITLSDTGSTFTESVGDRLTLTLSDTATSISESFTFDFLVSNISLVDTGLTLSESIGIQLFITSSVSDTGSSISEAIGLKDSFGVADTGITLTESITSLRLVPVIDTGAAISETPILTVGRMVADTGSAITDSIVLGLVIDTPDSITVNESATAGKSTPTTAADTITLDEEATPAGLVDFVFDFIQISEVAIADPLNFLSSSADRIGVTDDMLVEPFTYPNGRVPDAPIGIWATTIWNPNSNYPNFNILSNQMISGAYGGEGQTALTFGDGIYSIDLVTTPTGWNFGFYIHSRTDTVTDDAGYNILIEDTGTTLSRAVGGWTEIASDFPGAGTWIAGDTLEVIRATPSFVVNRIRNGVRTLILSASDGDVTSGHFAFEFGALIGITVDHLTISSNIVYHFVAAAANPGDSIGIAESLDAFGTIVSNISDTITVSTNEIIANVIVDTAADTIGLADVASGVLGLIGNISDSVGVADAVVTIYVLGSNVAETINIGDSLTAHRADVASAADSIGVTDSVLGTRLFTSTAADTIGMTDAALAGFINLMPAIDVTTITENIVTMRQAVTHSDDTIGIADAVIASKPVVDTSADSIGVSDADALVIKGFVTSSSDSISVAEQIEQLVNVDSDLDPDFELEDGIDIFEQVEGLIGGSLIENIDVEAIPIGSGSDSRRL